MKTTQRSPGHTIAFWLLRTIIGALLFSWNTAGAYEVSVHMSITNLATSQSHSYQTFTNTFGIDGHSSIIDGSNDEDNSARPVNHFYDPTNGKGLNINGLEIGRPSIEWGYEYKTFFLENEFSWTKAREYMYIALTGMNFNGEVVAATADQRNEYFQRMFRSVGQVMHLVEDLASPAHVRNDPHLPIPGPLAADLYEKYTLSFFDSSWLLGYDTVKLGQFSDFWNFPKGLAVFTNTNLISQDTNFDNVDSNGNLYCPFPQINGYIDTDEKIVDQFGRESLVKVEYGRNVVYDNYTGTSLANDRLTALSVFDFEAQELLGRRVYSVNDNTMASAAYILIPRAVGYAAGTLDYFFRGTLEITTPGTFVYSITDGSLQPQQFTQIRANVRNTTPGEAMQDGILQAVAQYKRRVDYQPDLSADPPTAASREAEFSYSVSAPISITSLGSIPTEFVFDFTDNPIPVGITDLYLHVIFKGTLGNETEVAIAVGRKDLNEPMQISVWNATDRFYLSGVLRTSEEIRNNALFFSLVDFNSNGILNEVAMGEPYIDPTDTDVEIAFYPANGTPPSPQAVYAPLPSGRHGRLIVLMDQPVFSIQIHRIVTEPPEDQTTSLTFAGVMNQENVGVFENTPVYPFRGILQHQWTAYARFSPDATGISTAPWPDPANTDPYPATTLNP